MIYYKYNKFNQIDEIMINKTFQHHFSNNFKYLKLDESQEIFFNSKQFEKKQAFQKVILY